MAHIPCWLNQSELFNCIIQWFSFNKYAYATDSTLFLTHFTYQMDGAVHLVQKLDGVRIIGNETHELLQRVPGW